MKTHRDSSSDGKQRNQNQVPPAQRLVILFFLLGATFIPLLGFLPFVLFLIVLMFATRSVKGFDKKRGMFVVPSYLMAIKSACFRLLGWLVVGALLVFGQVIIHGGFESILVQGSDSRSMLVFIFFALLAGHVLLLTRITWHLYKGREVSQGRYIDFGRAIAKRFLGFSEKPVDSSNAEMK